MRSLRSLLRGSAFLQRWRFAPYILAYAVMRRVAAVEPRRVLFLSDSRAGFSGNFAYLRDEIRRQDAGARIVGIFKPRLRARRPVTDLVRLPWEMARAQTIVLDDYYPLVYPLSLRPETRLLQVWHAAGAFKKVGWSRVGLPGGPLPGSVAHRNYTDVTVSSEAVRADYAEAFGVESHRVHALGVPRTDVFFDEERVAATAQRVRERLGIPAGSRIALFAPTFRGNGQLTATYDMSSVPWESLADSLGDGWTVLVKMHPFVASLGASLPGDPRIVDVSAERELNDLMMAADVLVTDYSSAIFEYALLGRPLVFFCPDLEVYAAERDFYHPFSEYIAGPLVTSGADLADAIRTTRVGPATVAFRERFMSACDGHSAERITREVILRPPVEATSDPIAAGSTPEPTRVRGSAHVQLLVAAATRIVLSAVYAPLKLLPTRRKVVMISREHPTEPADFADLRAAIHRADPSVQVVSLVRMVPPGLLGKIAYAFHLLTQLYHVATARVLVIDTYAIVASVLTHKDTLRVIQIWHALGAFKKFGLSILGQDEGRDARLAAAMRMHANYDTVLVSGEGCRLPYAEAFGTDPAKIVVAPLPRVDRLRDPERAERIRRRIHAELPHLTGRRIAVFAPTFRLDGAVTVDAVSLRDELARIGVHTVVKLHPLMHADLGDVDTAPGFSTQEMLTVADIFITDYSSALYEAALLGIPTYFLAPDLDDYLASRDFYLDYRRDLPGPIVQSVADVAESIAADRADPAVSATFADRWVQVSGAADAGSTTCADAIAGIVLEGMPEPGRRRPRT
ncbi:CDP-glycerol glycerophosphotransferase family protein [Microbacterium sp. 179-B 1A2 NHS]|uniref:CDP-glycerol glycerophosphotransferase family protein n=1 Tax=Microbacterium sp. 179-B 1A2 NHS TaxID=3142383 RepID=UPI0039A09180